MRQAKQIILSFSLIGVLAFNGCSQIKNDQRCFESGQISKMMSRPVFLEMNYLLYLPTDYHQTDKPWPLLVFLHGAGERGEDLNKVKMHGPPKLVEQGKELPFIIVSPQCPTGQWWPNKVESVMALIDEIAENYRIDEDRIYLTGLSMGGYGTWTVACMYPDRFAAIAPICGGGQPYLAGNLKYLPVWAFHGAKDPVVPLQQSQEMVDAINRSGGHAKLTVYPEADHDSWTQTYNNDEFYEWLLSHSNKSGTK